MGAAKYPFLVMLIVATFAVGFLFGRFSFLEDAYVGGKNAPSEKSAKQAPVTEATGTTTTTPPNIVEGMTDDQKKMLSALGIESDEITPAMIVCAETSLGDSRATEIKGGAALSLTEKVKLVACYK